MLAEPLWYWAMFAVAVVLIVAVPACVWWENRSDARDQDAWNRIHRPDLHERTPR